MIHCKKCGQDAPPMPANPYTGALGELVLKNTCPKCWGEWQKFAVMVINDYKLKTFLPQHREIIETHMKEFLKFESAEKKEAPVLTGQGFNVSFEAASGDLKERVIDMLKQIYDPEIPVNIYDLGLIYDVGLAGDKVRVRMTLTSRHCPAAQSLPETVRTTLARTPGVKEADVEVVWDPPWTKEMVSEEGRKVLGI